MPTTDVSIHNLASGSSANALLVRSNGLTMLVDCGLPIRKLQASLQSVGAAIEQVDVVFVTHEHSDHIRSLPQLRRRGVTIMTSRGTARALRLGPTEFIPAEGGRRHDIAGVSLTPRTLSHDSAEPLGLTIDVRDQTLTVLTDLGQVSEELIDAMARSDIVVLESNHDIEMLRLGPYPSHLKLRVLSGVGHLSNADCGKALRSALAKSSRSEAPVIWLAHLSETNNRPVTARTTVRQHIPGVRVAALPRHDPIDLLNSNHHRAVDAQQPQVAVQASLWIEFS